METIKKKLNGQNKYRISNPDKYTTFRWKKPKKALHLQIFCQRRSQLYSGM